MENGLVERFNRTLENMLEPWNQKRNHTGENTFPVLSMPTTALSMILQVILPMNLYPDDLI